MVVQTKDILSQSFTSLQNGHLREAQSLIGGALGADIRNPQVFPGHFSS